jgi:HD-like signal output (HDOD) protein
MLAAKWQFPAPLVACIRNHHAADAEASAMLDCLRVADQICRGDLDGERPADWFDQAPQAPARFGASLKPVIAALGNLDKIVAEARMFVSVDSGA